MVPFDFVTTFSGFLEREKISFAVIGAFALGAYGYVRATRDVDFVTGQKSQTTVVSWLESIGFQTIHRSSGFSNHLHAFGDQRVDLVYVDDRTLERLMADARPLVCVNDMTLPVVSALHLIELKLFAIQNDPSRMLKDLADIQGLLDHVSLDLSCAESLFVKYGLSKEWDNVRRCHHLRQ